MKINFSLDGDYYEDFDTIKAHFMIQEIITALHEADNQIRNRLKHNDDITEIEEEFLRSILTTLHIEGLQ